MSNHVMRNILTSAIYLIFAMVAVVIFTQGPKIEVLLNPVVGAFEVTEVWQEKGANGETRYLMQGAMLKLRGECEPLEVVMISNGGIRDQNAKVVRLNFDPDPISEKHRMVTRPAGSQHWGPWELEPPPEPIGPIVSIFVTHRCHSLWQQTQLIFSGQSSMFFPELNIDNPTGG